MVGTGRHGVEGKPGKDSAREMQREAPAQGFPAFHTDVTAGIRSGRCAVGLGIAKICIMKGLEGRASICTNGS